MALDDLLDLGLADLSLPPLLGKPVVNVVPRGVIADIGALVVGVSQISDAVALNKLHRGRNLLKVVPEILNGVVGWHENSKVLLRNCKVVKRLWI